MIQKARLYGALSSSRWQGGSGSARISVCGVKQTLSPTIGERAIALIKGDMYSPRCSGADKLARALAKMVSSCQFGSRVDFESVRKGVI